MKTKNYENNSTKTGIYMILNQVNNKKYIGSTKRSFHSRKTRHLTGLESNTHFNKHLQLSYNKYGSHVFVFEILEICDKSIVEEREAFYIKFYKTNIKTYGYNKFPVKYYNFEFKQDQKYIENRRSYKKEKAVLDGHVHKERGLNKSVYLYDINGKFIRKYNSELELVKDYKWAKSAVCTTLTSRKLYYRNHIILFSNDTLTQADIEYVQNKFLPKKIYLYDLNLNYIREFYSSKDAAEFLKCKDAEIRMCCLNRRSRIRNYITKYNKICKQEGTTKEN